MKHVVRVRLSHRVQETGSLCEHGLNVLLCNGKITADLLSSCDDCCYDAVCLDAAALRALMKQSNPLR